MLPRPFRGRPATLSALVLGIVTGCRDPKPDPVPAATTGRMQLVFHHLVTDDGGRLALGQPYQTANDEPVQIDHLRYYVSNVRLKRADSTVWTLANGYFLVDATLRDTLTLRAIPFGKYVQLLFDIGVDSVANARGDHTGDLDPARGMYWSWSTGYKFLSLDGKWLGDTAAKLIEYHIGRKPMLRTIKLPLPQPVTLENTRLTARAQLTVRPLTIFGGPNLLNLRDDQDRNIMFDTDYARRVADNYATMFRLTQVD